VNVKASTIPVEEYGKEIRKAEIEVITTYWVVGWVVEFGT
jgi:hypothetical protein